MYQGTTPAIILNLRTNLDLSLVTDCHVMFQSELGYSSLLYDNVKIDTEKKRIIIVMSQADTLSLSVGTVKIQVKMKLKNGMTIASKIIKTELKDALEDIII